MNLTLAVFIVCCMGYVRLSSARLLKKNPETTTVALKTSKVHLVRLTREVYDEKILTGLSKKDVERVDDDLGLYEKSSTVQLKPKQSKMLLHARISSASNENIEATLQNETEALPPPNRDINLLVKKPISKFKEMDYEDFQIKIHTRPIRFADSSENENEDYNVDNYDFDVNHDEFSRKGKPLQLRIKSKKYIVKADSKPIVTIPPTKINLQSDVIIPPIESSKNEKTKLVDKTEKMKDNDDYDDLITSTKSPEKKRRSDNEQSEENEESEEFQPSSQSEGHTKSGEKNLNNPNEQ